MPTGGDSGSPVVQFKDGCDDVGVVIGIHKASCPADRTVRCSPETPGIAMDIRELHEWMDKESDGQIVALSFLYNR